MKAYTIGIFAAAMLFSSATFAQSADAQKPKAKKDVKAQYMSLGPVAGFGHNWVTGMATTFKPSAYLGIGMLYSKNEHWGWGSTLTASHEGYAQDVYTRGGVYTNVIDPTYLRLTPRAYYFFGDYKDNVRPKVYLGPSVAYKLVEDQYIDQPGAVVEGTIMNATTNEMIKDWDFGVNAGAGVNIKLAPGTWLNLDADYYHGLLNVTNERMQNKSARVNVGFMFGI